MGASSSRYYIKFLGGIDVVDDYVSIGEEHHGGLFGVDSYWLGKCGEWLPFYWQLNEGDETPGGYLNDTIGDRPDPITSGIIYNSTHISGTINYTSIYSRIDEFVNYTSAPLDGAHNIELDGLTHSQLVSNETVYELVKEAIDDSPPDSTSTSATTPYQVLLTIGIIALVVISLRKQKKK
jgi:hypothetical protein